MPADAPKRPSIKGTGYIDSSITDEDGNDLDDVLKAMRQKATEQAQEVAALEQEVAELRAALQSPVPPAALSIPHDKVSGAGFLQWYGQQPAYKQLESFAARRLWREYREAGGLLSQSRACFLIAQERKKTP